MNKTQGHAHMILPKVQQLLLACEDVNLKIFL